MNLPDTLRGDLKISQITPRKLSEICRESSEDSHFWFAFLKVIWPFSVHKNVKNCSVLGIGPPHRRPREIWKKKSFCQDFTNILGRRPHFAPFPYCSLIVWLFEDTGECCVIIIIISVSRDRDNISAIILTYLPSSYSVLLLVFIRSISTRIGEDFLSGMLAFFVWMFRKCYNYVVIVNAYE